MKRIKYFLLCFVFFMIGSISVSAEEIQDGVYTIKSALDENKVVEIKKGTKYEGISSKNICHCRNSLN